MDPDTEERWKMLCLTALILGALMVLRWSTWTPSPFP
jgi:hypothetical protein